MLEGKETFCRCGEQLLRPYFLHGTRTRILLRFVRVREWGPTPGTNASMSRPSRGATEIPARDEPDRSERLATALRLAAM